MKLDEVLVKSMICPNCNGALTLNVSELKENQIVTGELLCNQCKCLYPIVNGVPDFVTYDNNDIPQKEFWENEKVLRRRSPSHPVIQSFAFPKVEAIYNEIKKKNLSKKLSLLDLGAGNGYFSYYLQKYFNVTCMDYSGNILSVCPIENKIQASALNIPFADNSFDIVFCANLLHHIENPNDVIKEMSRVASSYIVVIEPNKYNPFMYLISFISKTDKLLRRYTKKFIKEIFKGNLKIISYKQMGYILPNITPVFLLPILKFIEPFLFPKMNHIVIAEKDSFL